MTISNIFHDQGSTTTWRDSGGTYAITMDALAAGAGRVGARGDLGAWPHGILWRWYLETAWAANPVANETLDFFLALWDSDTPASPWAQVASTDSALSSAAQRNNLRYVGSAVAQSAGTGVMSSGGVVLIPARYISPVLYNASAAKALAAVGTTPTILRITPLYPQAQ
jgi:hypothetical protein